MKYAFCLLLAAAFAAPAYAERLEFDHRTYPPLYAVIASGRTEMIHFDDSNPKYVKDRIAVQGTSADHWTEALDIIVRSRGAKMKTIQDWVGEIQQAAQAACSSEFTTLAEDADSLTFARRSTGCPPGVAQVGLYRILSGKKSLFLLNPLAMSEMTDAARQQWLTMLQSAHVVR